MRVDLVSDTTQCFITYLLNFVDDLLEFMRLTKLVEMPVEGCKRHLVAILEGAILFAVFLDCIVG